MNIELQNSFYIIRHGKAKNNELGIESCKMESQKAYSLTSEGKEVVSRESKKYTDFDIIFSSPFFRTQETAAFFAETSNCEVVLDERLVDIDLGDLDLKPYQASRAFTKEHPDNDYVYPNGESFSQSLNRLINFMKDINAKNKNKKVLIVSHGFPCEALLDWVSGKPLNNWDKCIEKGKVFALES
ncbi:MAG: histidine phosphatase family protein [Candidatus Magasanikbacteria bacterium]